MRWETLLASLGVPPFRGGAHFPSSFFAGIFNETDGVPARWLLRERLVAVSVQKGDDRDLGA
ncbi:MAG: hypothetical protein CVU57_17510 [Deltaproteobacteria bacterium HGW-Deltaproteobacteria-15]|nr:MAG: hypothetical protein CVU57_17510 [Deltaproteobacteria bacterium HGW-Deltaproteobacteria-15]